MAPKPVTVIGAGLAGSECAWQLARRGHRVRLSEMRPKVATAAHRTDRCAELVCSNSFRSDNPLNAVGLLKREMEALDSLIIRSARAAAVPAGDALAMDRDVFAGLVLARSEALKRNTTVTVTPVGGDWANGWTASDSNGNTVRKQSGFTTVSITGPTNVVFTGSGRLSGGASPTFSLSAPDVAAENQRCVKVDLSGRPVSSQGACY